MFFSSRIYDTDLHYERFGDHVDATSVWYAHNLIIAWHMGRYGLSRHSHIHSP